jgi:hypothetical protein
VELGISDRVSFVHGDASAYVAADSVDVAACWSASRTG